MKVRFREGVKEDLEAISNVVVRKNALGWMHRIASGTAGDPVPCGWQSSTGDLSDCFKLYFDEHDDPRRGEPAREHRPRYYRVVYRLLEDVQVLEIVAVGPAHPPPGTDSAYVAAGRRLRRITRRGGHVEDRQGRPGSAEMIAGALVALAARRPRRSYLGRWSASRH